MMFILGAVDSSDASLALSLSGLVEDPDGLLSSAMAYLFYDSDERLGQMETLGDGQEHNN